MGVTSINVQRIYEKIGSVTIREEAEAGNFERVAEQYPEVYQALLDAHVAKPQGIAYQNYMMIHKGGSIFNLQKVSPAENSASAQEKHSEFKIDG